MSISLAVQHIAASREVYAIVHRRSDGYLYTGESDAVPTFVDSSGLSEEQIKNEKIDLTDLKLGYYQKSVPADFEDGPLDVSYFDGVSEDYIGHEVFDINGGENRQQVETVPEKLFVPVTAFDSATGLRT